MLVALRGSRSQLHEQHVNVSMLNAHSGNGNSLAC